MKSVLAIDIGGTFIKYGLIHTNLWILWIPQVLFLLMYFYLCHKAKICLNEEMKKM